MLLDSVNINGVALREYRFLNAYKERSFLNAAVTLKKRQVTTESHAISILNIKLLPKFL